MNLNQQNPYQQQNHPIYHPKIEAVDRLAEVRKQIRTLQAEARKLKAEIVSGTAGSMGQSYLAKEQVHLVLQQR